MKQARWSGLVLGALVLVAGLAGEALGAQPDWVLGESSRYPKERYLTGVGSGDTRKMAEDTAYAALARIFSVEIHQRTKEWEKYLQADIQGQIISKRDIRIEQLTEVSTSKVLENVSIAEIYLDKKSQIQYALAVMDRRKTSAVLRQRILSLDLKIEELLKQAEGAGNKLQKARALYRAVQTLLLRDAYNTELQVVSRTGADSDTLARLVRVRRELQDFLAKNFRIVLEIHGKHRDRLRVALLEGLTRWGLPVSLETVARADVVVRGAVEFQSLEMSQGKFVRWIASVELTDPSTGQVIGSVNRRGREGHITASEAEERALRAAERVLSEEIGSRLAGYIFGEEPQQR